MKRVELGSKGLVANLSANLVLSTEAFAEYEERSAHLNLRRRTSSASIGFGFLIVSILMSNCTGRNPQSNRQEKLSLAPETQEIVNPIFVISDDQVRNEFDEYELKGEQDGKVSIGEEQAFNVSAQGPTGTGVLKLAILFLTPLDHARKLGYEFGRVAKTKTAEDLKAIRNVAVTKAVDNSSSVTFKVKTLDIPKDPNVNEPQISFVILARNGERITANDAPGSFIPPQNDLLTAVAWAEEGQDLVFPVYTGSIPNLTKTMESMTLIIKIDDKERNLIFTLKRP